ncbi:MAG: VTT domain-containing protein [Acidobacteriota bacterium]|nr:MAG: VTT domain-containing protein [Acidobacteriota bacterium]
MLDPATIAALLFLATFVTEDAACVVAGSLAAGGAIGLELAIAACFGGIFVSDLGLYFIGRVSGRAAARSKLFRRFVSPRAVERGARWLEQSGPAAIFVSRFASGLRLPTYVAAGFLRVSLPKFAFYFFVAAAIWTPLLVGSVYFTQTELPGAHVLAGGLLLLGSVRIGLALSSRKRRKKFAGSLIRVYRWEFWPVQIFYVPVVIYVLLLGIRFRSLTVFTAANPAIPGGGFVGESKDSIYRGLSESSAAGPHLLHYVVVDPLDFRDRDADRLIQFVSSEGLRFPLVVKPDAGERGKGVTIAHTPEHLREALRETAGPQILQEFADGDEFSVFYYRFPGDAKGRIFSVTEKLFPEVTGDGVSSVEELILNDPRAVCMYSAYLANIGNEADRVPSEGERVRLIEIGTHARGAVFNDGDRVLTAELENAIDEICRGYDGFYFGRFDLRVPTAGDLSQGKGFKIVELNGVTSESTNIYDRGYSLVDAYRILFRQWAIAFEIGNINRRNGARTYSVPELLSMFLLRGRLDATEEPA